MGSIDIKGYPVGGARADLVTFREQSSGVHDDEETDKWSERVVDKIRDVRGCQVFAGEGGCRSYLDRWSRHDSVET